MDFSPCNHIKCVKCSSSDSCFLCDRCGSLDNTNCKMCSVVMIKCSECIDLCAKVESKIVEEQEKIKQRPQQQVECSDCIDMYAKIKSKIVEEQDKIEQQQKPVCNSPKRPRSPSPDGYEFFLCHTCGKVNNYDLYERRKNLGWIKKFKPNPCCPVGAYDSEQSARLRNTTWVNINDPGVWCNDCPTWLDYGVPPYTLLAVVTRFVPSTITSGVLYPQYTEPQQQQPTPSYIQLRQAQQQEQQQDPNNQPSTSSAHVGPIDNNESDNSNLIVSMVPPADIDDSDDGNNTTPDLSPIMMTYNYDTDESDEYVSKKNFF